MAKLNYYTCGRLACFCVSCPVAVNVYVYELNVIIDWKTCCKRGNLRKYLAILDIICQSHARGADMNFDASFAEYCMSGLSIAKKLHRAAAAHGGGEPVCGLRHQLACRGEVGMRPHGGGYYRTYLATSRNYIHYRVCVVGVHSNFSNKEVMCVIG